MKAIYQIWIAGVFGEGWSSGFPGFTLRPGPSETTLLTGTVPDQAALFGVLNRIRDLGVPLLGLRLVEDAVDPGPGFQGATTALIVVGATRDRGGLVGRDESIAAQTDCLEANTDT